MVATRLFCLATALLCCCVVEGSKEDSRLMKAAEKCRAGTEVTKEIVEALLKGKMDTAEPEYSTKCYFKCFLQELNMMMSDGSIELDANHGHFADCANSATDDDWCDRAYHFNKCIHGQNPDLPVF